MRLFGPPRTPAELAAAARGDTADTAAELAAAVAQAEAAAAQLGFAGAAGEPLEIVVELVLVEGEEEQVQARWSLLSDSWRSGLDGDGASLAELLVQLPEPAGAAQLGRKAAAGAGSGWAGLGGLFAVLGGSQQQPSRPQVPASPWVLAAVDTLFVAATSMAVVCAVLLAADIRRHGWRRCSCGSGSGRGSSGRGYPAGAVVSSKELLAPLLVVAAEEVAAAGAKGQH